MPWLLVGAALFGTSGGLTFADTSPGATVSGQLIGPSVVWVDDGSTPVPISAEMRNADKSFVPDLLAVPVGSTVRFPNDDPFFHSIYSISDPNDFDVGFYATGPGKAETFTSPGIVEVHCHIHAHMHATIVVVSGSYENVAGKTFSLPNVRPGTHVVYAWNLANGLRAIVVTVPPQGELSLPHPI